MKSVTILSVLLSIFAVIPGHTQTTCSQADQMAADIKVMKEHDRALLNDFYRSNMGMLEKLRAEAKDAMDLVRQATVNNSPKIREWAKNIRDGGDSYLVPVSQRLMGAEIHRILPKFLSDNWFFQVSGVTAENGKMVPVFEWDEETLKGMEVGFIRAEYYTSGIRRMKRSPYLVTYEPAISLKEGRADLVINQSYEILNYITSDGVPTVSELDRKPWEIAVYYGYDSKRPQLTTLPLTYINGGVSRQDTYEVQYDTAPLLLDLTNGQIRTLQVPQIGYENLDPRDPSVGTARIVSGYMHQRWSLERQLKKCK